MRSYADLGLKARIPLTAGWTAMDDALLKSLGDEAVGVISAHWYSADGQSASNKQFIADMQKEYQVLPGGYSAGMYIAGQCVEAAICSGGSLVTGWPKTSTAPRRAGSRPTVTFMQVVLPAPLRPSRPSSRPSPATNDTLARTWLSP